MLSQIVVTVWKRDAEPAELQEGGGFGGYLGLLQGRAPTHVFRQEQGAFKAQGTPKPPGPFGTPTPPTSLWHPDPPGSLWHPHPLISLWHPNAPHVPLSP